VEATLHDAPLTILTVHPMPANPWTDSPVAFPGDITAQQIALEDAWETALAALRGLDDGHPPEVTVAAVSGSPAEELIVASRDADLMVIGSRGRGGSASCAREPVGSVSAQVVRHAASPVVVVPSQR
jgi:nucleotide-binding universal stress UspA family protein